MNITEDYCSYEIAKLLKEKGFPQEYDIYHSLVYNEEDYEDEYEVQRMVLETRLVKAGTLSSYPIGVPEPKCYCPTRQMAMKWLREEYGISIEISALNRYRWVYTIYRFFEERVVEVWNDGTYVSYEDATDDALKYCLENLNKLI